MAITVINRSTSSPGGARVPTRRESRAAPRASVGLEESWTRGPWRRPRR